jgi:hypothetical protein
MALSIIRWHGEQNGQQEFDAEIGSNRFYAWGIGTGATKHEGVKLLADRSRTSPLLGPLEPGSRGRVVLRVPSDAFTQEHHHLQLLSFRDEELRGPAASDLVDVPWRWSPKRRGTEEPMTVMPLVRRSSSASAPAHRHARLSHAQFLDALAGMISQVLPIVSRALPVVEQIGKLIGSPAAPAQQTPPPAAVSPPGTGTTETPAAKPASPDLAQLLTQLLAQVERASAATATPPAGAQSLSSSNGHRYSYASIAPLLAALPALAPLLQSVLNPQTVQSLIQAGDPTKLLQATFAGLMDAARIGQQATDQLHAHLRALNPGLGDDVLIPLLASMSTAATYNDRHPRRTLSRVVRLELPDLVPVDVGGYPQVAFRHGEDMTLPLSVDTPRTIPRPRLHVCVKDAQNLDVVAERTWTYEHLEPGRLPQPVILPAAVTRRLIPGKEYLVGVNLEWPGANGLMGAVTNQLIRVVGEAFFDSLDTGGPPIRLDDVERDRDWWHRIWADDIDERNRRTAARLDYEFRLLPQASANRRTRTSVDLSQVTDRRAEGTLRAGMGVALSELSRLADRLTGTAFDQVTMQALADDGFAAAFDRQATCTISTHGRRGARLAVWVWPEVKLHTAFLKMPGEVSSQTGQVLSFDTTAVHVPVPGLVHVLTTRSE